MDNPCYPLLPPAIIVHGLADIRAALAPGRPVTLLSAPGAAAYAGPAWWAALLRAARHTGPALLDCADAPGRAWEGLALGLQGVVLPPCPGWNQLAAYAAARNALLLQTAPPALDMAQPGTARRLEAWLDVKFYPNPPAGP